MNTIKVTLSVFALAVGFNAQADLISATHTTADGKDVALQGLEWMSLDHTADMSRNDVTNTSGFTDNFGTHWDANIWRYATNSEVGILLQSLYGGAAGSHQENYDGAHWFDDNFVLLADDAVVSFDGLDFGSFIYGSDFVSNNFCCTGPQSYLGTIRLVDPSFFIEEWGNFSSIDLNLTPTLIGDVLPVDLSSSLIGSMLVRTASVGTIPPTEVPEPGTLALLGIGLAGLGLTRRRRKI